MRRTLALLLLLALPAGGDVAAQALDDVLVPQGRVRLQMFPVFTSWDSRFGRTAAGVTGREELGEDLTSANAESLFPGTASLIQAIESMSGTGYTPVLGETLGRVTKDVTRIEFGGSLGVFDWLTVGAVLPWTRTRTDVDVAFRPDTLGGNLGLNPAASNAAGVNSYLQAVSAADAAAGARATQVCGTSPGSPSCASAQALADRVQTFSTQAQTAYGASPFFPVGTSATAASLSQAQTTLDADLVAAGLGGIGVPMVFATQWVGEDDFATLSALPGLGVGAPLADVRSLWHAGDVELSASVRLLEGALRDSVQVDPWFSYRLVGTVLGRLPTGATGNPDSFLSVGTGDGQADIEGRLLGDFAWGRRIGLRVAARYGIQMSRDLVLRVAPPEQVLAPLSSRQLLEWNPGSYFGIELAPAFRLAPELTVGAEYRVYRKYRDTYELTGASLGAPVDPTVLEVESGVTLHQMGGILRYDTVARRMSGGSVTPMQLHLRVLRSVAGGGGQTAAPTHLEFGVRFFRRFWGAP